jgi:carboxypeptidase C (cathepsin A)
MLFLSQPVGVGFSYGSKVSFDILIAHVNLKLTKAGRTKGRYSTADYPAISMSHQLKLARRD